MHPKDKNLSFSNMPLSFKAMMLALFLFFAGKPVLELCSHVFDMGSPMELCETLEEDSEEKVIDDLEEEELKLMNESLEELSVLADAQSKILYHFYLRNSDFKPGVQTPPPEYTFYS